MSRMEGAVDGRCGGRKLSPTEVEPDGRWFLVGLSGFKMPCAALSVTLTCPPCVMVSILSSWRINMVNVKNKWS